MNTIETFKDIFKTLMCNDNGCILWPRTPNISGYGGFKINRKRFLVHRLSYQVFVGPIPPELCVLHKCDQPLCINPQHLFIGTRDINNKDRAIKQRSALGERSGRAKLSEKDVRAIRKLYEKGSLTTTKIGGFYGISNHQVSMIGLRKSWSHLQ